LSNRKAIDLRKRADAIAKPRTPRPRPDRRVRNCCLSRQGDLHGPGCTRKATAEERHAALVAAEAALGDPEWLRLHGLDPAVVHPVRTEVAGDEP